MNIQRKQKIMQSFQKFPIKYIAMYSMTETTMYVYNYVAIFIVNMCYSQNIASY